eukprot:gene31087-6213_t
MRVAALGDAIMDACCSTRHLAAKRARLNTLKPASWLMRLCNIRLQLWKKPVHDAFELSNFAVQEHQQSDQVYDVGFYRNTENIDDDLEMEETLAALDEMNSLGEVQGYTDQGLDIGTTDMETGVDLSVVEDKSCHAEVHAEYNAASVIKWGAQNIVESAAIKWISGAIYAEEDKKKVASSATDRLKKLQEDTDLPIVFLDVAIKGKPIGRIKILLFAKDSPRAAENFRALCTGEKGVVPSGRQGAGKSYHFKGSTFYRIIDRFIDQSGANTESVFGGTFMDDIGGLALKHDRKGLLSMANAGPDTNTSHFSIMMAPAPHLDARYTIFGEVIEGMEIAEQINALSKGKPENTVGPEEQVVIVDCGQLR